MRTKKFIYIKKKKRRATLKVASKKRLCFGFPIEASLVMKYILFIIILFVLYLYMMVFTYFGNQKPS